ncbi:phage tail protein [Myxococcus fulvus]|uniref:phage tail protein n=1 Tax=Myxococcus fulvus TaxID=33 RepID=UPI0020BECCAF|nr:phage tail protein [Myxococcus fulvus]MCK8498490.1 phage tail protein [Myxococcus fulvus]
MADAKATGVAPSRQGAGTRVDPFRAYNFKLLIDGVNEGHFTQCTDLEVEVITPHPRERLAGPVMHGDLTLRYGVTQSPELWNWFLASMNGGPSRKNVSVLLFDGDGMTQKLRWDLNEAWPKKWRAAPLDVLGQQIAVDSLTLVFESITRG